MKKLIIMWIFLFIEGCAAPEYVSLNGRSPDYFATDQYNCEQVAAQYIANTEPGQNYFWKNVDIGYETAKCLKLRYGWIQK